LKTFEIWKDGLENKKPSIKHKTNQHLKKKETKKKIKKQNNKGNNKNKLLSRGGIIGDGGCL
jgi:hypothetical protein